MGDHAQPVGSLLRDASRGHRGRGRGRRHGSPFGPVLGRAWRGCHPELPQGRYRQGVVSEVDVEKERISLSIKAVGGDKFADAVGGVRRGSVITVNVTAIEDGGIEVEYEGMKSFIRRSDLSRDRAEQRPERFSVGDKVDVRVTNVDNKTRRLGLSIKAREIAEEKEAVEQYGSSDSGASLGDILGAALKGDD